MFAALFLFSLTELELRRHSQLSLFFSLSFSQLCSYPVEGSLSFSFLCLTSTPQRSVHKGGGRERERERESSVSMCGILGQTLQPLHLFLLFCLSHCLWKRAITYCKRTTPSTEAKRKKERGKSERERKTRTKATTG